MDTSDNAQAGALVMFNLLKKGTGFEQVFN
jgi:hypothetical protein